MSPARGGSLPTPATAAAAAASRSLPTLLPANPPASLLQAAHLHPGAPRQQGMDGRRREHHPICFSGAKGQFRCAPPCLRLTPHAPASPLRTPPLPCLPSPGAACAPATTPRRSSRPTPADAPATCWTGAAALRPAPRAARPTVTLPPRPGTHWRPAHSAMTSSVSRRGGQGRAGGAATRSAALPAQWAARAGLGDQGACLPAARNAACAAADGAPSLLRCRPSADKYVKYGRSKVMGEDRSGFWATTAQCAYGGHTGGRRGGPGPGGAGPAGRGVPAAGAVGGSSAAGLWPAQLLFPTSVAPPLPPDPVDERAQGERRRQRRATRVRRRAARPRHRACRTACGARTRATTAACPCPCTPTPPARSARASWRRRRRPAPTPPWRRCPSPRLPGLPEQGAGAGAGMD